MALTCLQIIQTACTRIGILPPNAAITSQDALVQQMVSLCNLEGQTQAKRYQWQSLQKSVTFTTANAEIQGLMSVLAPGWKFILNDTIWNRTQRWPIRGSISPQSWQEMVAMQLTSPWSQYRIMGDVLHFYPFPDAGATCAFEYVTKNWVTTTGGGSSNRWTTDQDISVLDDDLLIGGVVWRWKSAKGLDYAEDFASYERDLADAMSRDGTKPILRMNGGIDTISPVVIVPAGSWGV